MVLSLFAHKENSLEYLFDSHTSGTMRAGFSTVAATDLATDVLSGQIHSESDHFTCVVGNVHIRHEIELANLDLCLLHGLGSRSSLPIK